MLLKAENNNGTYSIPLPRDLIQDIFNLKEALEEYDENIQDCIHAVLKKVWMTKWMRTEENTIPCPTERLLALLTLGTDGKHKEPHQITGYLAKLEYCIRLCCLWELKVISATSDDDDEATCNLLQPWFTEKTYSPFSRIRSLQHRASSIAYTTMSLPRIWWTDRKQWMEMLYKGEKIHIDGLRTMFVSMETKLVDLWEKKVLAGISIRVCYRDIQDDITNHDVGYSFLGDRRNTCFAERDRFLKALIDKPEIFSQFAVIRDGQLIWNKGALVQWLRDYAEFQKLVLARCEMLSGAPGRGTELTAMTYRNTKYRSQRNLVMLGKHLTMLRTYHKSGSMSGLDKLIPHSIDGVTADIMIQDLALTRPFAEIAAHICYPDRPEIKKLYQTHIFVNNTKLFDTDQLSATMARESVSHLGFGLGVNSWRHISIAFKRKLGRFAEELLEEDELDTVDALQAGHSRSTENRVYGLSPDALAGAPEDLLPQFLQASTNWQLLMHTVPGGLELAYAYAKCCHFKELAASGKLGSDAQTTTTTATRGSGTTVPSKIEVSLSTESMANRVAAKLEEKLLNGLEDRIIERLVGALGPAIEGMVQKALKIPTNDIDFDDIYQGKTLMNQYICMLMMTSRCTSEG